MLIAAVDIEQKRKPLLMNKSEKLTALHLTESDNLRDIEKNHNGLIERLNQEKGGWQSKLESAEGKEKKYINLNIQKIIERVSEEGILISKKTTLFKNKIL
ncbi:MAG: hypothetical protein IPG89_18405 [Bacteroidetes bacterium]|nr:hypothetical protein [Bacteroidota bacterium]